jgi:hypothetical protein
MLVLNAYLSIRASKRNFARWNKTALGPGDRDDTVKQPEFRSPSEFYIIIFLNTM